VLFQITAQTAIGAIELVPDHPASGDTGGEHPGGYLARQRRFGDVRNVAGYAIALRRLVSSGVPAVVDPGSSVHMAMSTSTVSPSLSCAAKKVGS
jgi:hypothetical protein